MAEEKYKVGDKEVTLDELIKGYMKDEDYRRKTQTLADERKRLEDEASYLRNEADRAGKWDQWYLTNKDTIESRQTNLESKNEFESEDEATAQLRKEISQLSKVIKDLETEGRKEIRAISLENERFRRALKYSFDLDSLKDKHLKEYPDVPFYKEKIIEEAYGYNKPELDNKDWEIIYNQVYRDEFVSRDVERKVAEKLKVEEEKAKSARTAESGEFIKSLKLPEKVSTHSAAITEDVLSILSEERAKRGE
jgi:DNA repair ATPase RecN